MHSKLKTANTAANTATNTVVANYNRSRTHGPDSQNQVLVERVTAGSRSLRRRVDSSSTLCDDDLRKLFVTHHKGKEFSRIAEIGHR